LITSSIANPGEQLTQTPLGTGLVVGLQVPAAVRRGEAMGRVYKDVKSTHGTVEGLKAAVKISPEIIKAIAEESIVEESPIGKLHHKVSEVVNRTGIPPEFIQAFWDLYYGVEKTAPGAEAIFRRTQREVNAKTAKFEDTWGDTIRNLAQEDVATLYDAMSKGQESAHYAAFLLSQLGKMKGEGGSVAASKLLRSKEAKTQAQSEALTKSIDNLETAIKSQKEVIAAEALENADVLREVVSERAVAPEVDAPVTPVVDHCQKHHRRHLFPKPR